MGEPGATMRSHYYQVSTFTLGRVYDFQEGRSNSHQSTRLDSAFAQARSFAIQFLQCQQASFLRDPVHRADIEARIQLANHDWSQWLVDVNHYYFRPEFLRQGNCIGEGEFGVFREVCRCENLVEGRHERTIPRQIAQGKRGSQNTRVPNSTFGRDTFHGMAIIGSEIDHGGRMPLPYTTDRLKS